MRMFRFVLLVQFSILFEIAVALLFIFCHKLKSGLYKCIFPTIQKPYICVCCNSAMAGPSDAMKPERFAVVNSEDGRLESNFGSCLWNCGG